MIPPHPVSPAAHAAPRKMLFFHDSCCLHRYELERRGTNIRNVPIRIRRPARTMDCPSSPCTMDLSLVFQWLPCTVGGCLCITISIVGFSWRVLSADCCCRDAKPKGVSKKGFGRDAHAWWPLRHARSRGVIVTSAGATAASTPRPATRAASASVCPRYAAWHAALQPRTTVSVAPLSISALTISCKVEPKA